MNTMKLRTIVLLDVGNAVTYGVVIAKVTSLNYINGGEREELTICIKNQLNSFVNVTRTEDQVVEVETYNDHEQHRFVRAHAGLDWATERSNELADMRTAEPAEAQAKTPIEDAPPAVQAKTPSDDETPL